MDREIGSITTLFCMEFFKLVRKVEEHMDTSAWRWRLGICHRVKPVRDHQLYLNRIQEIWLNCWIFFYRIADQSPRTNQTLSAQRSQLHLQVDRQLPDRYKAVCVAGAEHLRDSDHEHWFPSLPLLSSLYSICCTSSHLSVKLIKSAVSHQTNHRQRWVCLQDRGGLAGGLVKLNTQQTVEVIVDFRKVTDPTSPLVLWDRSISIVDSFRFHHQDLNGSRSSAPHHEGPAQDVLPTAAEETQTASWADGAVLCRNQSPSSPPLSLYGTQPGTDRPQCNVRCWEGDWSCRLDCAWPLSWTQPG